MSDQVFDFRNLKPPKVSMRLILIGVAVLAGLSLVFGSFYQIQPEEVGLVLRFGRHVRTTDPGLNLKMPFVEDVLKVPVQRQLKQEFGFSTRQAQGRPKRGCLAECDSTRSRETVLGRGQPGGAAAGSAHQ